MPKNNSPLSGVRKLLTNWQSLIAIAAVVAIVFYIPLKIYGVPFNVSPLLAVIVVGGIPLFLEIILKLFKGDLGADLLAALALVTAVVLGQYLAATLLILMLASGQSLESYAVRKASTALLALADRMPTVAHKLMDKQIVDITIDEIQVADILVIYPHEACPVDGIVVEGHGSMDESYLTGEPYRISKAPGSLVLSGALNMETALTIKAEKLPSESHYSGIVEVLREAEQKRPRLRRLGDQIGAIFAPFSIVFALLAWYFTGDPVRFLAVLVIATPCPLLIAIPITVISAISLAARKSIIIKDPTILERLPTCKTAIFDKTGTLTYGKPTLTEILTAKDVVEDTILQQVASLERYSKHPLSSAIIEMARVQKLPLLEVTQISEKPGQGLEGTIDGHVIHVTHRKNISENFPEISAALPAPTTGLECIILYDHRYVATFHFRDVPREESQSFIGHLIPSHQFERVMLVSGDRASEVSYLGKLLQLTEVHSSQTPAQKLAIVRAEVKKAPTLFMGDGINDAPALTAATVGLAFGEYSSVTAEAAGAVIMENTLHKVDELIHLSLNTRKIAMQSAVGGMLLSAIGMGFAAAGFITPVVGALLQEVIDVVAIINSLRLTWKRNIQIDLPE